jgi:hypothetical protein
MKLMTALAVAAVVAIGQSGSRNYGGTWTAEFGGATFVRLQLHSTGGVVGGELSLGNIEVDQKGVVKKAGAAPRQATPIFDVKSSDARLAFARKDGKDTDRFELKLIDGATADLVILLTDADRKELAATGIPAPQPIRLHKQQAP